MKKKLISLLLVVVLTLTMVACGSSGDKNGDKEANNGSASNGPTYVTEPITINFWHIFGSGETADYMNDAVKRFNETNEYDITVNATSVGSYSTLRSQLTTSIGAGDNPQIVMLGFSDIMASAGVLVWLMANRYIISIYLRTIRSYSTLSKTSSPLSVFPI